MLLCWGDGALAASPPCEDSFVQFFYQMYRQGSYCTCQVAHQEVVTEQGRVRHEARYTLPDLPGQQLGAFFQPSQVRARFWGTILQGPGGWYGGVIRVHEEGRSHRWCDRFTSSPRGRSLKITDGVKQGFSCDPRRPTMCLWKDKTLPCSPNRCYAPGTSLFLPGVPVRSLLHRCPTGRRGKSPLKRLSRSRQAL